MVFRRRPIRWGHLIRRDLGQPKVPPIIRQQLLRAQQAVDTGDYESAIRIYSRLAREGYARGHYRPGAQMDIAAVRVLLRAGRAQDAATRTLHATRTLLENGEAPRGILPLTDRIVRALASQDSPDAAVKFREDVNKLLTEYRIDTSKLNPVTSPAQQATFTNQRRLPAQCTACYAPLDPDDVEWLSEDRIRCPYCGRVVLAE